MRKLCFPLLLFAFFASALSGVVHNVSTRAELVAAMQIAVGGDIVDLGGSVIAKPEGAFDNRDFTPSITIRNGGFDCLGNGSNNQICFGEKLRGYTFERIVVTGWMNGNGWARIVWRDGSFLRGAGALGLVLKCTGCSDYLVERNLIQPDGDAGDDMALDFIATTNVRILNNRAILKQSRGLIQTKGDTVGIEIRGNHLTGGGRAIQIGGSAGAQFWRRPPATAKHEAAEAIVSDNFIERPTEACAVFSTFRDVVFERNTCLAPPVRVYRILYEFGDRDEAGNLLTDPNRRLTIRNNAIIDFAGLATNFVNISNPELWPHDFPSMSHGPDLYAGFQPGAFPAGFVEAGAPTLRASVALGPRGELGDSALAVLFGVRAESSPPPPQTSQGLSYVTQRGDEPAVLHSSYEAARAAVAASPCDMRLWRIVDVIVDTDIGKISGSLLAIPITFELDLPISEPIASADCCDVFLGAEDPEPFSLAALTNCCALSCSLDRSSRAALRGCACLDSLPA